MGKLHFEPPEAEKPPATPIVNSEAYPFAGGDIKGGSARVWSESYTAPDPIHNPPSLPQQPPDWTKQGK